MNEEEGVETAGSYLRIFIEKISGRENDFNERKSKVSGRPQQRNGKIQLTIVVNAESIESNELSILVAPKGKSATESQSAGAGETRRRNICQRITLNLNFKFN